MTLRTFSDMYCWCCHLEDAMYRCKTCPRTYHRRCLFEMPNYPSPIFDPDTMDPSIMNQCPECIVAEETALPNMKRFGMNQLCTAFNYVIHSIKADETWERHFYHMKKPEINTQSGAVTVKFMDVATIENNVDKLQLYKTLEGFFGDVKWIRHNAAVTSGRRSDELSLAEKLVSFVASEMLEIDLCYECYVRKQHQERFENSFVQACTTPHLLAWAKYDNYAYWPAKVMAVDLRSNLAIVNYFGLHSQAELDLNQCLLYRHEVPSSNKKNKVQSQLWKRAHREIKKHLEYLEEQHGKVVLAEEKTRISISLSEAVQRMFPDWKLKTMNEDVERVDTSLSIETI